MVTNMRFRLRARSRLWFCVTCMVRTQTSTRVGLQTGAGPEPLGPSWKSDVSQFIQQWFNNNNVKREIIVMMVIMIKICF